MATENKRINTRILLKYDTYANWTSKNPVLLAGEVAIATIDTGDTQKVNSVGLPQVLIKVGDGTSTYSALPFVSGLAADVYSWAKAANKPTYAISEITGAKEYTVTKGASEYEWKLQAKAAGSGDAYADVATIDLAAISTRIKAVEDDVADHETRLAAAEGTIGDASNGLVKDVADLKAAVGTGGSVQDAINNAINALDTPAGGVSQAAGADGLALNIVQENGVVTSISGSIAANTYDAHGAAAAVEGKLNTYKTTNDATVKAAADAAAAAQKAADDEKTARENAIDALDFSGVTGTQTGTEIKFVNKVSQTNGVVSAELGTLAFQTAISADNKAATMADVTGAVADLNGAMHFEGVKDSLPAVDGYNNGDVIIVGVTEYVMSNGAWVQLGDEGALGTAIAGLKGNSTGAASKTVTAHAQANGIVELTYTDIAIGEGQVTGLTKKLTDMQGEIDAEETRAANAEAGLQAAVDKIEGTDEGKSMREVAEAVSSAGLTAITNASIVAPTAAQTIKLIKQTNGVVEATAQDIQIAESQVTGLTDALAAKATKAEHNTLAGRVTNAETAINTINNTTIQSKIDAAIGGLDKADAAVAGEFVTAVSEENGIINVTRGKVNVKDLEQTADTYVVFYCGTASEVM